MDAIVYGTKTCVWCDNVVRDLKKNDAEVTKIDVSEPENFIQMKKFAGEDARTVPQVVIDGKYIGGYTEVHRFLNSLKPLEKKPQIHRG